MQLFYQFFHCIADVEDKRKRPSMSDDAVERSAAGESSSGLDLSVKRQKVDQTYGIKNSFFCHIG